MLLDLGILRCSEDRGGRTIGFIERQRRVHDGPLQPPKLVEALSCYRQSSNEAEKVKMLGTATVGVILTVN